MYLICISHSQIHLFWIFQHSWILAELERLVKQKEELSAVIQKIDTRLNNLQSSAFALANYYVVFQGVILTIICNGAKNLKPSDRWFLFTISILVVLLNLCATLRWLKLESSTLKIKVLEKFFGSGAAKCMGKYSCLIVATRTRK